ncbi:MAG: HAMP domain-containing sensor histidine kinase [Ignavibacteria bacterium]|jgi:nitrogen-specific signal transduction histidine kinase|nr:HAMP domain-containing sensor histidine kinase [Ignavibacteria bacterium]MDP3831577.1 HAMP domain-containing sensor histidine kinase [Ignavibacteriaceae bacterium]
MKMSGGPASVNIKISLLIIAFAIGGGTLFYTNDLVNKLQEKEKQYVQFFANGLEYVANSSEPEGDITFLFENIIRPIDFPMILTNANNEVNLQGAATEIRNIRYDSTLSENELQKYFTNKINEMDAVRNPILVKYVQGQDTIIFAKIHYGDSELINQLKFYPYIQILIVAIFIIIGYIGFSQIKKSEQSNIWVGMAKETAHQFGTPISSLMGWLEILRMHYNDPDKVLDTAEEIENDVEKLNKITHRFSKIGSKPELKSTNIYDTVNKVIEYFKRRLPQTGKSINISIEGVNELFGNINAPLFEWVIENLIKNALDAIDQENGKISILIKENRNKIEIDITDNGKGIDIKRRKDVFRPGYSTKRRGWGLGLSLSKRIIEEYHNGKIFVKASAIGEGTTFKLIISRTI